jgi:hypothetical protein
MTDGDFKAAYATSMESIDLVRLSLETLTHDIREIRREISELRRPQYHLLVSFVGVSLVLVGGLWSLAISPIKEELATFARADMVQEHYVSKDVLNGKLAEINERLIKR